MTSPLIGITAYETTSKAGYPQSSLSQAYTSSVAQAGGTPVIIPLGLAENSWDDYLSKMDGFLFSGGGDVHPRRYGNPPHTLVDEVDEARDRMEIHLIHRIIELGKPFFGICRGIQVINVALGGTLYEDILEQHPGGQRHQFSPEFKREHLAHSIQVNPGSQLFKIFASESTLVNSMHHQGLCKLAPTLQATAHAPDGIIEAIETPSHPFALAVQWHPENLQAHPPMRHLFEAFIQAC